jgi:hypothetical protein
MHPAHASLHTLCENLERLRWFSPELRENLLPPTYPQRLELLEPLERIGPGVERSKAVERLERLERIDPRGDRSISGQTSGTT